MATTANDIIVLAHTQTGDMHSITLSEFITLFEFNDILDLDDDEDSDENVSHQE